MNANYDTFTIDLNIVRGAVALPIEAQLFPEEMERAIQLVEEFARAAQERQNQWDEEQKSMPWKDPELLHEALLVSGPRGSGKTTFLLSIFQHFQQDTYTADPSKRNVKIAVLPPLDPTLVPNGDMFIGAVIANILRRVEGRTYSPTSNRALSTALQKLSGGLLAAHPDVWKKRLESASSESAYAEHLLRFSRDGLSLRTHFGNFVSAAAAQLEVACFVQPIDDVDVAGKDSWNVLEATRRYLTTPRILPIITGHLPQFRAMVLEEKLGEVTRRRGINEKDGSDAKDALEEARALANQHLLKLIRPERRILLTSARDAIKLWKTKKEVRIVKRSGGSSYTIDELLRPVTNWILTNGSDEASLDILPENARLMRAFLAWLAETGTNEETGKDGTNKGSYRAFNHSATWIGLLDIDGEAQESQGWNIDDQTALANGDYRSLLTFLLDAKNTRRSKLQRDTLLDAPWAPLLVDIALIGGLRARFSGPKAVVRALRYWVQVAYPIALFGTEPANQASDERRKQLNRSISGATVSESALQLAVFRWPTNNNRQVAAGLAHVSEKKTATPSRNPTLDKLWMQRKKLAQSGHGPWIKYLLDNGHLDVDAKASTKRLSTLRDWVRRKGGGKGPIPNASPYDQLVLRYDQVEYLIKGPRSPQEASGISPEEKIGYARQWTLLETILVLFQSKMGSGNATMRMADPIAGIAAICSLLERTATSPTPNRRSEAYIEQHLRTLQSFSINSRIGISDEVLASLESEPIVEDEDDIDGEEGNDVLSMFGPEDEETKTPTFNESNKQPGFRTSFPPQFIIQMQNWIKAVNTPVNATNELGVHPSVLSAIAESVVDVHRGISDDSNKTTPSLGSFLQATILATLNAILTAENRTITDFDYRGARTHIQYGQDEFIPSGIFQRNLTIWKEKAKDSEQSGSTTLRSPMFTMLATCPLIHAILLPCWSQELWAAMRAEPCSLSNMNNEVDHWRSVTLTTGAGKVHGEYVDLAVLLHAIPIHVATQKAMWDEGYPWAEKSRKHHDDWWRIFENAHLAARGRGITNEKAPRKTPAKKNPSDTTENKDPGDGGQAAKTA